MVVSGTLFESSSCWLNCNSPLPVTGIHVQTWTISSLYIVLLKRAASSKCQNMIYYPKRPFIEGNNLHLANLNNKKVFLLLRKCFSGERYPFASHKSKVNGIQTEEVSSNKYILFFYLVLFSLKKKLSPLVFRSRQST